MPPFGYRRWGTLLRNAYSGSQIGNYVLPKAIEGWKSLFGGSGNDTESTGITSLSPTAHGTVRTIGEERPSWDMGIESMAERPLKGASAFGGFDVQKSPSMADSSVLKTVTPSADKTLSTIGAGAPALASGITAGISGDTKGAGQGIGSGVGTIAGTAVGGPIGGAIGSVLGGIVGGLFGGEEESPEEIAQRRIKAYTGWAEGQKGAELGQFKHDMSQSTANAMRTATNIAGRQAGALGKSNQVASFALPATANIAMAGSRQMKEGVRGITNIWNQRIANAQESIFGVPAEEFTGDVMSNMADVMSNQQQMDEFYAQLGQIMRARNARLGYSNVA